ncbi:MAG: Spo0B C-terminal domain-containing protein [Bacillus sp. (in: firmicutes)]
MEKKWGTLELIGLCRHDWLNRIQLIKGNLELGKMDHVNEIVEAIIQEAKNEAQISRLQMPKLAELLITSNWLGYPFSIDYEVLDVRKGCQSADVFMYNWTVAFFDKIGSSIDEFVENELKMDILQNDDWIRFSFDLEGKLKTKDEIGHFLSKETDWARIRVVSFAEDELIVELFIDECTG